MYFGFRSLRLRALILVFLGQVAFGVCVEADVGGPEFDEIREKYLEMYEKYPEKRKNLLDKMLSDYLASAKSRYAQEQAASNLKGMGVAKAAIETIEAARSELAETGDFSFENVRHDLKDFFDQIAATKEEISKGIKTRKERLRRSTFARFIRLYKRSNPDADDNAVIEEFDRWLDADSTEEQDVAESEKEDKRDGPRVKASELGLDLFADEFRQLEEVYRANESRLEDARNRALDEFLQTERESARDWYAEQKRVRNVKGMAIAGRVVNLIEEAQEKLAEKGEFALPEKGDQREEVQDYIGNLEARMSEKMKPFEEKRARLDEVGFERFIILAEGQGVAPDGDILKSVYEDWIARKYTEREKGMDVGAMVAGEPGPRRMSAVDQLYFAQQGDADEWFTVGTWKVEAKGMDIFTVPLYEAQDREGAKRNIQTGQTANWKYTHGNPLEERKYYAFRLKKIEGCRPVAVVGWPSLRNNWMLEVRTANQSGTYGFEIQAGRTVGPDGRMEAKERFEVPVITEPSGARVYVNGSRQYQPNTDSVTPMVLDLAEGVYEVSIEKDDHLPKVFSKIRVGRNTRIESELRHESELPGQRITFAAGKSWTRTKVKIKVGDKIWVVADGRWACGMKGETVGPKGYPESEYPHYYSGSDLRKFKDANYGALLMKVGEEYYDAPAEVEDKRAIAVGDRVAVVAGTWGELWFDVNELEGHDHRRDNRGTLTLKVVVLPGGELPAGR